MDANDFMSRGRMSSQSTTESPAPSANKKHRGPRGFIKVVMAGMVVSVAILMAAVMAFVVFGGGKSEDELIKADQYQAVFLNDQSGQVYFGKLSVVNTKLYRLTDVFYVPANDVQAEVSNATDSEDVSLAKPKNEQRGPEDEMFVPKDMVLFWENLKNDGEVVTAITKFKSEN